MKRSFFLALPALFTAASLHSAPLQEARVARIINDVSVIKPAEGTRAAALNELIKDDTSVKTGIKSRSELLFQDDTLTRLGPESFFSFQPGTRDMSLQRGTMLLQVPKGNGGAKIRTAAVTAAITGTTIMLEHLPGKSLKVLVLEGSLRLSVNGRFGDSLLLLPGKMVIMPPNAKRIPDPVSVDIAKIVKTSALVNMGGSSTKPLPSMPLIDREIAIQATERAKNGLVDTNLVIDGGGSKVTVAQDVFALLEKKSSGEPEIDLPTPTLNPTPAPTPAATPVSTPGATATPSATASPGSSPTPTPTTGGGDDDDDADDDDSNYDKVLKIGSDEGGDVNLQTPIDLSAGGKNGKVKVNSKGNITVGTTVKVSESSGANPSKKAGRIELTSHKKNGTAIMVTDSGQLLSLLNAAAPGPGGRIRFQSDGGTIYVKGGKVQADRGTIDMKNVGQDGAITLENATLHGDKVKARVLGKNGELNIGGGTISADTLISLYAGGSNGEVNFTDNVTLSGTSVKNISGNTVTIRDGKVVNVTGPAANVFTNIPNYSGSGGNGSTTGAFGGSGATTQPLSASPGSGR